jgi:hypothetical protein
VTEIPVVVTWQIVGNCKFVVVAPVRFHDGLVAFALTKAVDKIAICADTGPLATVFEALTATAVAVAERMAAPFARNFAQTVALGAFALLAHAFAVALDCLALVTAHQICHAEKTTTRVVEVAKSIQVDVIRHDVKSVPSQQQVENQDYNSINYFIIISKSIFKIRNYLKTLKK